jgi:hypothetical protein
MASWNEPGEGVGVRHKGRGSLCLSCQRWWRRASMADLHMGSCRLAPPVSASVDAEVLTVPRVMQSSFAELWKPSAPSPTGGDSDPSYTTAEAS